MRDTGTGHHEHGRALRELLPWAPTALGVCALVVLLFIAATRFSAGPDVRTAPPALPVPALPAPAPAASASGASAAVPSAPLPSTPASARPGPQMRPATATTVPRPGRTSERATTPAATPGPVRGRYRVVDSYSDAFIGEVLITNAAARDGDWRVELRFPAAVGDLITSWVESAPQATLRRAGDRYIWTSGAPVPARGQVALRFHFSRSGTGDLPSACTVNGQPCTGTR